MSVWSTKLVESAQFLCICTESVQVAVLFRQFVGTSTNCLMDPSAPPTFPAQLGCQGFVIIDAEGKFITTRSASFLEISDAAFRDVESKIRADQSQLSSLSSGESTTAFQSSSSAPKRARSPSPCVDASINSPLEVRSLPTVGYSDMDAEHEKITEGIKVL